MLAAALLPPINDGLNFHQTHESAAEAAGVRVSEKFCNIRQALTRIGQQAARNLQSDFVEDLAVACAHAFEMTLQCAPANSERMRCAIEGCVTVPQRCNDDGADRRG